MTIQGTAIAALSAGARQLAGAADGVRRAAAPPSEGAADSVDLSEQAVRLLVATHEYKAAIELARTADEIAQSTLDLLA